MSSSTVPAHVKNNVLRMMERLGVEPGGGVVPALGLRYATVLRACAHCGSTRTCSEWLAGARESIGLPPRFCPCADLLFEMQFDQPGQGGGAGDGAAHRH